MSFTPGAWKFVAVAYGFVTFLDNLAEAVDWWTWGKAGLSALAVLGFTVIGHRPSPRRLW